MAGEAWKAIIYRYEDIILSEINPHIDAGRYDKEVVINGRKTIVEHTYIDAVNAWLGSLMPKIGFTEHQWYADYRFNEVWGNHDDVKGDMIVFFLPDGVHGYACREKILDMDKFKMYGALEDTA